jgi:ribosomal protein S18 acetylase RimI-like enzyme
MPSNLANLDEARVAEIEGDVESFAVNPKLYAQLRRFCCGNSGHRSEREVNRIVREYASGRHKDGAFRVTVERRRLVGVAAFQAATASHPDLGPYAGSPVISVLGLSEQYRGRTMAGRRLGDLVLEDALQAINTRWRGTPNVYLLVNPNNTHGRSLFERNGFRMIVRARRDGETDALFRRNGREVRESAAGSC